MNLAPHIPFTAAERKTTPAGKTLITDVENRIQKGYGTLKTPAAINGFWLSMQGYVNRHVAAGGTNGTPATTAATPASRTRKPARTATAKNRTRTAGAAA